MSESDDDWATEELPPLPVNKSSEKEEKSLEDDEDDDWQAKLPPTSSSTDASKESKSAMKEGEPMLIVDMTQLSNEEIHSRFDPNSVNDPAAVKRLRLQIENQYDKYARDASLLADRTVIPCGSSVWKSALAVLRKEKCGNYFCPIFPPKK